MGSYVVNMTTSDSSPEPYGPGPHGSEPYGYPAYRGYSGGPYGYDPTSPYGGYPMPPVAAPPAPPGPGKPSRRQRILAGGLAALLAGGVITALAVGAAESTDPISGSGSAQVIVPTIPGDMNRHPAGTSTSVSLATAAQEKGIVTVVSVLKYQNAESAGTGMVLTPSGEILTNNHVVNGATSIAVTVASTGKTYRADVVGTDPSDDVAVLQLQNASNLQTANVGDSAGVAVGDDIVGVGNAGGTGTLRASAGTVTALNKSITATDETGSNSEKLKGLIQVHAPIVSGDSGGPLYNSAGQIVGMDTAASANQATDSTAYAIPIDSALAIAGKIETGVETAKIHIGLPAFLGVSVNKASGRGALVEGLLSGGPAASAGITSGSVVTKVGSATVTSPDSLRSVLRAYNPGDKATVAWTTAGGSSRTATVTLGTGPAD
jgi:S1-C subfamily serine protease